jgi:hypothetical protein
MTVLTNKLIKMNKITNIKLSGIDFEDYPDFVDAYIESADYDGEPMTDEELDELNDDSDFVYNVVWNNLNTDVSW